MKGRHVRARLLIQALAPAFVLWLRTVQAQPFTSAELVGLWEVEHVQPAGGAPGGPESGINCTNAFFFFGRDGVSVAASAGGILASTRWQLLSSNNEAEVFLRAGAEETAYFGSMSDTCHLVLTPKVQDTTNKFEILLRRQTDEVMRGAVARESSPFLGSWMTLPKAAKADDRPLLTVFYPEGVFFQVYPDAGTTGGGRWSLSHGFLGRVSLQMDDTVFRIVSETSNRWQAISSQRDVPSLRFERCAESTVFAATNSSYPTPSTAVIRP